MADDHAPPPGVSSEPGAPAASLRVSVDHDVDAGAASITPVGDLDLHTTDRVAATLDEVLAGSAVDRIRLDASLLRFVDSAGLRCLVSARTLAAERGVGFAVVNPSRALRRVLEMTGLGDLVDHEG
jgi:anti-sigma B factor antagonist